MEARRAARGYDGAPAAAAATEGTMALEVGKQAPEFALPDEDGEVVKLSDFKGKRLVVFFYSKANTSG
jgi:peroxiredoxin Q/BCP